MSSLFSGFFGSSESTPATVPATAAAPSPATAPAPTAAPATTAAKASAPASKEDAFPSTPKQSGNNDSLPTATVFVQKGHEKLKAGIRFLLDKHKQLKELRLQLEATMVDDMTASIQEQLSVLSPNDNKDKIVVVHSLPASSPSKGTKDIPGGQHDTKLGVGAGLGTNYHGDYIPSTTSTSLAPLLDERAKSSSSGTVLGTSLPASKPYGIGDFVQSDFVTGRVLEGDGEYRNIRIEGTGFCKLEEVKYLRRVSPQNFVYSPDLHRFCSAKANELHFAVSKLQDQISSFNRFARMIVCAIGRQLKAQQNLWCVSKEGQQEQMTIRGYILKEMSTFTGQQIQCMTLMDSHGKEQDFKVCWDGCGNEKIIYFPSCSDVVQDPSIRDTEVIEMLFDIFYSRQRFVLL